MVKIGDVIGRESGGSRFWDLVVVPMSSFMRWHTYLWLTFLSTSSHLPSTVAFLAFLFFIFFFTFCFLSAASQVGSSHVVIQYVPLLSLYVIIRCILLISPIIIVFLKKEKDNLLAGRTNARGNTGMNNSSFLRNWLAILLVTLPKYLILMFFKKEINILMPCNKFIVSLGVHVVPLIKTISELLSMMILWRFLDLLSWCFSDSRTFSYLDGTVTISLLP